MNYLGIHLGGSADVLGDFGIEAVKNGVRTVQVHLSSPRKWDKPNIEGVKSFIDRITPILNESDQPNMNWVVHGPFGVSLSKPEHYGFIVRYFVECSRQFMSLDLPEGHTVNLVTHVGSRVPTMSYQEVLGWVSTVCTMWEYHTEGHRTVLCLENDAGSKNKTKIGSLKLLEIVMEKLSNLERVRICWDTEHAYANGLDLSNRDRIEAILKYAGVVHLNSIPEYVERGGHLDRHSDVLIKDGKHTEDLLYIAKRCQDMRIPMVLERSRDIVLDDFKYVTKEILEDGIRRVNSQQDNIIP